MSGLGAVDHLSPLGKVRLSVFDSEVIAYGICKALIFKPQRNFIKGGSGQVLDNVLRTYITEHCHFVAHILGNFLFTSANEDIGLNAHGKKLLGGVLSGLGLKLLGACDIGNESYVDIDSILSAHLCAYLSDSLKKGGGLDIAHSTAYLGDNDVGVAFLAYTIYLVLYLVCDVGDNLNGAAKVISSSFLIENGPVDLSGGYIGIDGKVLVNESFIMSKVKVGLGSVIGNENLAVLIG